MKLFLDAGNTRIKWQLRDGGAILASDAATLEDETLFAKMALSHWQALSSVSVCTVRSDQARKELELVIGRYTDSPVRFYWTRKRFEELVCAYREPATMGSDRWHAIIGAWDLVKGAFVVVDAGSAITVDWVDHEGSHQGGYILPGRNMMLRSLSQNTARVLFDADEARVSTAPGRSTGECVLHGVSWLLRALALQLDQEVAVPIVVTGGDGHLIKAALEDAVSGGAGVRFRPGLVLDGLALAEARSCDG